MKYLWLSFLNVCTHLNTQMKFQHLLLRYIIFHISRGFTKFKDNFATLYTFWFRYHPAQCTYNGLHNILFRNNLWTSLMIPSWYHILALILKMVSSGVTWTIIVFPMNVLMKIFMFPRWFHVRLMVLLWNILQLYKHFQLSTSLPANTKACSCKGMSILCSISAFIFWATSNGSTFSVVTWSWTVLIKISIVLNRRINSWQNCKLLWQNILQEL